MMQDVNMSPSCSSLKLPFHPIGLEDTISDPEPGASDFREFVGYDGHSSKIRSSFGEEDMFCNFKRKNENMGIGNSLFTFLSLSIFCFLSDIVSTCGV